MMPVSLPNGTLPVVARDLRSGPFGRRHHPHQPRHIMVRRGTRHPRWCFARNPCGGVRGVARSLAIASLAGAPRVAGSIAVHFGRAAGSEIAVSRERRRDPAPGSWPRELPRPSYRCDRSCTAKLGSGGAGDHEIRSPFFSSFRKSSAGNGQTHAAVFDRVTPSKTTSIKRCASPSLSLEQPRSSGHHAPPHRALPGRSAPLDGLLSG